MKEIWGYTINELIHELEVMRLNLGTGEVEVMLPQSITEENGSITEYDAHIAVIQSSENKLGETIVVIY